MEINKKYRSAGSQFVKIGSTFSVPHTNKICDKGDTTLYYQKHRWYKDSAISLMVVIHKKKFDGIVSDSYHIRTISPGSLVLEL
jgi:hypothetical protein